MQYCGLDVKCPPGACVFVSGSLQKCLCEVKNETQVSAALAGAGPKLPESDLAIYFSYTFKYSLLGKRLHLPIITTKL